MSGGSKYFFIVSKMNGMVLDLAEHGQYPGCKVFTWTKKTENFDNQLWFEDPMTRTIRSKEAPGMCLDVPEGDNTLQVNQLDPTRPTQRWTIHEDRVQNYDNPDLCLDIAEACGDEGARVCAWNKHDGDNQKWEFDYLPAQHFFIKSKMNGKVLDIKAKDASPGAAVIMWEQKDSSCDNQLWYEDRHGYIRSKLNDFVIENSDGGLTMQPYSHGNKAQHWCINDCRLANASNHDEVADICECCGDDGAKVVAYSWNGGDNQCWEFEHVELGY